MKAILALEDGTHFVGRSFGARGERAGEMVFNTSMTGYQEILTDPSYAGQIVAMTYPHIGNYGVNEEDNESRRPFLRAFVVRELSRRYSNWRAGGPLEEFLSHQGIMGIEGVDTRALTRHIRSRGAMRAVVSTVDDDPRAVVEKAKGSPGLVGVNLVREVTVDSAYEFGGGVDEDPFLIGRALVRGLRGDVGSDGGTGLPGSPELKVIAFDFGVKGNIVRCLERVGCRGRVVPASTSVDEVLAEAPDGVFLSNGPGDPAAVTYAVETIRGLLGKVPVFGICLGHQLLSLALGGATYKLKFGHRGGNQPVKNTATGKIEITSQNHGFAVDAASLPADGRFGRVDVTHLNLNDNTVEGLRCLDVPAFSVQYHPEASPGPHDSFYLFSEFVSLMAERKGIAALPS